MKLVKVKSDISKVYSGLFVGFAFFALTVLTIRLLAPEVASNAETVEQTVGPYTLSMSSDAEATLNITPTQEQTIYTTTNNLSITNSCDAGATVTITTGSDSTNGLVRSGVDSLMKEIEATSSANSLDDFTWGFSIDDGATYSAVPKLNQTAATVYTSTTAQTTAHAIPILFGIKANSNLPSGAYTNDVIYTMAPNPGCLVYAITWDLDGGTAPEGATYPTSLAWGETIDLSGLTPTREGYTFNGWSNGSSTFTGSETEADVNTNENKTVTIKPEWAPVNYVKNFSYTGSYQTWSVPYDGKYRMELWGAQGGMGVGGNGGWIKTDGNTAAYVAGTIRLNASDNLYLYVGQKGKGANISSNGGWNGGGNAKVGNSGYDGGGGGGATDIRYFGNTTPTSSNLQWNAALGLNSRLIVAAGGSGVRSHAPGGGILGYNYNGNTGTGSGQNIGATQTSGYAFGIGGPGTGDYQDGSGGGWYGGYQQTTNGYSGSGATSYISGHTGCVAIAEGSTSNIRTVKKTGCTSGTTDNDCSIHYSGLLFTNTNMIDGNGHTWTTSDQDVKNDNLMPKPSGGSYERGTGHTGNGYIRITFLGS